MFFPEVIDYLLTLRYPGSETGKQNWVCYLGTVQIYMPLVPPLIDVAYSLKPPAGVCAWLAYSTRFSSETVPNTFTGTITQAGSSPYSGVFTQRYRDENLEYLALVTEAEPTLVKITNIGPLAQKGEALTHMLVIPTPQDLVTVTDALRRLHTSTQVETLLQQATYLLGVMAGQPVSPKPPLGGS